MTSWVFILLNVLLFTLAISSNKDTVKKDIEKFFDNFVSKTLYNVKRNKNAENNEKDDAKENEKQAKLLLRTLLFSTANKVDKEIAMKKRLLRSGSASPYNSFLYEH
nr:uncharacterized protein LOC124818450 [Hydra vulgaris]